MWNAVLYIIHFAYLGRLLSHIPLDGPHTHSGVGRPRQCYIRWRMQQHTADLLWVTLDASHKPKPDYNTNQSTRRNTQAPLPWMSSQLSLYRYQRARHACRHLQWGWGCCGWHGCPGPWCLVCWHCAGRRSSWWGQTSGSPRGWPVYRAWRAYDVPARTQ